MKLNLSSTGITLILLMLLATSHYAIRPAINKDLLHAKSRVSSLQSKEKGIAAKLKHLKETLSNVKSDTSAYSFNINDNIMDRYLKLNYDLKSEQANYNVVAKFKFDGGANLNINPVFENSNIVYTPVAFEVHYRDYQQMLAFFDHLVNKYGVSIKEFRTDTIKLDGFYRITGYALLYGSEENS